MEMILEKKHSCYITGPEPSGLPWGHDESGPECLRMEVKLYCAMEEMRLRGVNNFISGMARGVELWAAEIVMDMKRAYPQENIRLIAVLPFEEHARRWSAGYRERYDKLLAQTDAQTVLHARYQVGCTQECLRYMTERAAHMIAVYDGRQRNRTRYALDYARSRCPDILVLDPLG